MIGSVLRVRYEVTGLVQEGPVFTTYTARDRVQNKDASVRVLDSKFTEAPFSQSLAEVVSSWSNVEHPNLQRLTALDSDGDHTFVVGDAPFGQSLLERIRKLAPFTAPTSVAIAIGICEALAAIHEAGKVHGDVGAHNVNVNANQEAQLEAAGLWEAYGASTGAGAAMLGLMAPYLAPEVSSGDMPSARSDVYGVGIILFELLTGRSPYVADKPLATAVRHGTQPTPSVRDSNPSIPSVLNEIILQAMAKDPNYRYANAGAMLKDLRMLQDAMRFGRTLSWPLTVGVEASSEPASVAPRMSAVKDPEPKRERIDAAESDVPTWLKVTIAFLMGFLALMVLAYVVFNMRKPQTVNVPELRRLSIAEARDRLNGLKLNLKEAESRPNEEIPDGQIIESSPAGGRKVFEGAEINVVVSAGSKFVEIPDIRGLNMDKAKMLLASVGLELDPDVRKERKRDAEPGMIIESSPARGRKVLRGTRITVTVASDRRESQEDPPVRVGDKYLYTVKIKTSGLTDQVLVRVDITDDSGTRTVHEDPHMPDEEFTIEAEGYGSKATFTIYYDGELVKTVEKSSGEDQ